MKYPKQLLLNMILELSNKNSEYTFGEILYTICREKYVGFPIKSMIQLRVLPDSLFCTAIEKAINKE